MARPRRPTRTDVKVILVLSGVLLAIHALFDVTHFNRLSAGERLWERSGLPTYLGWLIEIVLTVGLITVGVLTTPPAKATKRRKRRRQDPDSTQNDLAKTDHRDQ
jgi:hypothetical protein